MSAPVRTPVTIPLVQLANGSDLPLPAYATDQSAGADLLAAIDSPVTLAPASRAIIPTGVAVALPHGFEAQIRPRSGLAAKYGITVLNSPGTIDADYRGEIGVILINHGTEPFEVTRGMRIAQMVIAAAQTAQWQVQESLDSSPRGDRGFGSTGTGIGADNKTPSDAQG